MFNEINLNVQSFIGIAFLCFSLLFLLGFILKRSAEQTTNKLNLSESKRMSNVFQVKLPFTLISLQSKSNEESEGCVLRKDVLENALLEIKSSVNVSAYVYYYVAIGEIQKLYQPSHPQFKGDSGKTLQCSLDLLSSFKHKPDVTAISEEGRTELAIHFSVVPSEILTTLKTLDAESSTFVPLVILMSVNDIEPSMSNNDIIALASVIVRRNNKYEIKEQYIQTVDDRVIPLKQIFDSGLQQTCTVPSAPDIETNTEQICVVCHEYPVTRVILPCRHASLCKLCFHKVDTCPICRMNIQSFFLIRTEEDFPHTKDEVRNEIREDIQSMGIWNFIKSVWNAG